jgi:hypothetical protein
MTQQQRLPGLTPGKGTARRRSYVHGYTRQDREAMKQIEYLNRVQPVRLAPGVAMVLPLCTCDFRPYPHSIPRYTQQGEDNPDYIEHALGRPPRPRLEFR